MKVYCDRLAEVTTDLKGQFPCPKCDGVCVHNTRTQMFDCKTCGRGWYIVPDKIKTAQEAEAYLARSPNLT